MADTSNGPSQV